MNFNHDALKPYNSTAFELFGIEVKWYGLLIVTGALIALWVGLKTSNKLGVKEEHLLDGFILGMIFGILGARIYYVIFEWDQFKGRPFLEIIGFGPGGMQGLAIHGALIATAIFVPIYCKIRKINIFKVGEIVAPGFLIGQIMGRWGNFFNQEATGPLIKGTLDEQRAFLKRKLLLPDFIVNQMYIQGGSSVHPETGYYHPTFLYESVWNLIGLVIIFQLRKRWKDYWVGDSVAFYLIWYSFGRFWIEALRTDSLMIGAFKQAQIISVVMIIAGIALFSLRRVYRFHPMPYQEEVNKNIGEAA